MQPLPYVELSDWLNDNQGVLALALFAASAAFAWFSGIIAALRRRPRLNIRAILGPTLCTVIPTGREMQGRPSHRTSLSLYLHIANAGSAPTSLGEIRVGYRWPLRPFSRQWWTKTLRWHWVDHQVAALADFQAVVSPEGDTKFYPFLTQRSVVTGESANGYLDIGEMTNGVVYFEEPEAWGGGQPLVRSGHTSVRVEIEGAFGGKHRATVRVPVVSIEEARRYNPRFGDSLETIGQVKSDATLDTSP